MAAWPAKNIFRKIRPAIFGGRFVLAGLAVGLWCALNLLPAARAGGQAQLTDSTGRPLKPGPYKRIISLYGAHTENLFYLGLDQEIIGVSPEDDYPPQALGRPTFSSRNDPEKFLAAEPDLLLVRPFHLAAYSRLMTSLEKFGVTVAAFQVNSIDQLPDYWRALGALTGRQDEAERMIADFDRRLARLTARLDKIDHRPLVFMESVAKGVKTYTGDSLPIWVLTQAGGRSAAPEAASSSSPIVGEFGLERLTALRDEIEVYLIVNGAMNQTRPAELAKRPVFRDMAAVRRGRVHQVDEALVARPTPRLLDGVLAIEAILFPDLAD